MRNRGFLIAVVLSALLSAAYWFSPRYALKQLQTSLATSDILGLERYIDWPSVRTGLRTDVTAIVLEKTSARINNNPTSTLAAILAPAVVTYLVETSISSQGLIKLAEKQRQETGGPNSLILVSAKFTDIDQFTVVVGKSVDQETIRAIMTRDGFHWKITRVLLPANLLEGVNLLENANLLEGIAAKNEGGSATSANDTASIDDAPASGSLDLGHGSTAPGGASSVDAALKADAQAAAARLNAIDNETRMRAQAAAVSAERAQTDAAIAQAQALSHENTFLRRQARDAELARERAEEAAYDSQQQRTVVFVQPRYGDRRPNGIFNGPHTTGIERKNTETSNNTPQGQGVSSTPSGVPRTISPQNQSPTVGSTTSSNLTTNSVQQGIVLPSN